MSKQHHEAQGKEIHEQSSIPSQNISCLLVPHACVHAKLLQSCLTLGDPMDSGPPSSSVHGNSPGKNPGEGCRALLQQIFTIQGLNPHLFCLLPCATGDSKPGRSQAPIGLASSSKSKACIKSLLVERIWQMTFPSVFPTWRSEFPSTFSKALFTAVLNNVAITPSFFIQRSHNLFFIQNIFTSL